MNRHGSMIVPPCLVVGAAETFGLTPDPEPLLPRTRNRVCSDSVTVASTTNPAPGEPFCGFHIEIKGSKLNNVPATVTGRAGNKADFC
jgi:hypothetical protein